MAHGGPDEHVKRRNAADDESFRLDDSADRVARMLLVVMVISTCVWGTCTVLRWLVHVASDGLLDRVAAGRPWAWAALLGALAAGGVVRGLLLRKPAWADAAGDGVDVALMNYHCTHDHAPNDPQPRYARPAFRLVLRKAVMTLLTLGSGASGGLEAPVVLVGEGTGAGWSRVFRVKNEYELRTYQMSGIAAAVATLLGAPFTAALFAAEIAYTDRIVYRKFVYALLAGVVCYVLNNHVIGWSPLFVAPARPHVYDLAEYAQVAVVSLAVSAPVALGMGMVFRHTGGLVERVHPVLRGAVGAVLAGGVALAAWYGVGLEPHHLLGMGERTLHELLEGTGNPLLQNGWILMLAVLGRILTTSLTLQSGGSAGMLIPGMFMGGVSGAACHHALLAVDLSTGADPSLFVVSGIAAALVAIIGVPLAAIALVLEVFGSQYGPSAVVPVADETG
jgi:CIC family chloride channel protein